MHGQRHRQVVLAFVFALASACASASATPLAPFHACASAAAPCSSDSDSCNRYHHLCKLGLLGLLVALARVSFHLDVNFGNCDCEAHR